ncbi:hypothetical protein ABIC28_005088, partial [Rhodococcus sp. PvR044]|uniref:hypothetical protein n=1 Tax=Rhodococcus sp. PvR044 TaxID=3156402 RepID=UPI0033974900
NTARSHPTPPTGRVRYPGTIKEPTIRFSAAQRHPSTKVGEHPMVSSASWTHGNSTVPEIDDWWPDNPICRHRGWGFQAIFIGGSARWFHIPLPTPVIQNEERYRLTKFFLLWGIEGDGVLGRVHLFDGPYLVSTTIEGGRDGYLRVQPYGYQYQGVHHQIDSESEFHIEAPHNVAFGMGISFLVGVGERTTRERPVFLTISTAGADYEPIPS